MFWYVKKAYIKGAASKPLKERKKSKISHLIFGEFKNFVFKFLFFIPYILLNHPLSLWNYRNEIRF